MTQKTKLRVLPPLADCCRRAESAARPEFFRALADPTRLGTLFRLAELGGEATVGQIACCCTVDLSVVSRHLATLRAAGIVEAERSGKEVRYRVRWSELVRTLRSIADSVEACCPAGAGTPTPNPKTRGARP